MVGAPFASIRIAERFRSRASTTIAGGNRSARGATRTVRASRHLSRPRSIRRRRRPSGTVRTDPGSGARSRACGGRFARAIDHDRTAAPPSDTITSTAARDQHSRAPDPAGCCPCPEARAASGCRRGSAGGAVPSCRARQAANSPLGVWLTEEKEGKVRIEQCGANLCGYSVDTKSNKNGEQVLINMRPGKDAKWSGRILDPNTGSTYDFDDRAEGPGYACGSRAAPSAACSAAARPGAG